MAGGVSRNKQVRSIDIPNDMSGVIECIHNRFLYCHCYSFCHPLSVSSHFVTSNLMLFHQAYLQLK